MLYIFFVTGLLLTVFGLILEGNFQQGTSGQGLSLLTAVVGLAMLVGVFVISVWSEYAA